MSTTFQPKPLRVLLAAMLVALALALAACGSSSSSSSSSSAASGSSTTGHVHLAKTKFVLHAGLAFGTFHRYIWKPARAGTLTHPLHNKATLVKAALAAAFIHHELGLALHDAQADPRLAKLVAPITALEARMHGQAGQLRSGTVPPGALSEDNGSIGSIEGQSAGAGQPINEQAPSHI